MSIFTWRSASETPASPTCFDTVSADIIVNSFTFKLQDFVSPEKLKQVFQKKGINKIYTHFCNLTFTITNQVTN